LAAWEHLNRNVAKRTDRDDVPSFTFNYRVKCACLVL